MKIKVQSEQFNCENETSQIRNSRTDIGAEVSFIGYVRGDDDLISMTLEHYPGMVEKSLEKIAEDAGKRWKIEDGIIIHRYGKLFPGDPIVFVSILSKHRDDAFEAARFIMDWLKTKAPFWKLEERPENKAWVKAKTKDEKATEKWDKKP